MTQPFDDAVVGAGIIGLAHAYHLARRGRRVVVFERGPRAQGASVRNFGMLWPIGQPPGRMHQLAMRSSEHWLTVLMAARLWHAEVGSLHLAYRDDEEAVLREFAGAEGPGYDTRLLSPIEVCNRTSAVRQEGLRVGLFSPTEICVDPREVIANLPAWLSRESGVSFEFGCTVTDYSRPSVRAGGREWRANRLWVCAGDDIQTLYPAALRSMGLRRCKLQMMRTRPYGDAFALGPMLAGGLTLRHYASFARCPSLPGECVRRVSPAPSVLIV